MAENLCVLSAPSAPPREISFWDYGFLSLSRVGLSSSFHGNGAPFT